MNKNYFTQNLKACLLLGVMFFMCVFNVNAQSVKNKGKNPNDIEKTVQGICEQLGQDLLINKEIGKPEAQTFFSHYAGYITDLKAGMYRNVEDDSINAANTGNYIKIIDASLSALYEQYKTLPLEERNFGGTRQVEANPSTEVTWPGACEIGCQNTDFSAGTLANWMTCYSNVTTTNTSSGPFTITAPTCTGILAGTTANSLYPTTAMNQVQIVTGGVDPVCGAFIPQVCNNPNYTGTNSVEIGDYDNANYGVGVLEQSFTVTANNDDFTYWYAVVLENPSGHGHYGQPFFNVFMYDQAGKLIPFCGNYAVTADSASAQGNFKGFYYSSSGDTCYCRPWTQVFVPLKAYIGQCVTIKVLTADCYAGGHFGYGYFASKCNHLGIITSAPALCGNPITLTGPAGGASYKWSYIGAGSNCIIPAAGNTQTITVSCPGKYQVIVYSYIGASCADTLDTVITSSVATAPKPNFKSDTVCEGNPTQFTNLTTGGNPATNTYTWTFQGGTTSSAANPTFTFPAAGAYPATFTVMLQSLSGGCGGDTTLNVVVNGPPTAGFSAPPVCQNSPTLFNNTSTGTATFKWIFGDGSTSNSASPQHTYATCGTFNVILVAGTAPCVDSAKNTITVNPNPSPGFTASPVCLGSNTVFTDTTKVGCGGTEASWSWAFGDPGSGVNNTSTSQNPTHVFADTGCYSVLFKITTSGGCKDSTLKPVCIVGPPTPKFISTPVCVGLPTVFTNQTTPTTSTSKWSFGDPANGTSTATNPSYTYTTAGTYTVKLISTSGAGCVDSTKSTVTVNPPPTSGFTADTVCLGNPTAFKDTSHGGTTFKWSFGDAAKGTSAVQNPTYTYATSGTFQVTEVVTTASGCKDSIKLPVVVDPAPTATITVPPVCLGTASVFTLTASMPCTYSWTMGDGVGTSTAQNPTYTYLTNGSFTANVVLTSATGSCPGKASVVAIVNPIPVPKFTAPPVCQDQNAVFTNGSTIAAVPAPQSMTYAWNFGDGATSTAQSPSHHYAACGTYNVILTATSVAGCSHDTTIPVIINPVPAPNFTSTSVCKGLVTQFTDKSTIGCGDSVTKWNWNFGDGSAASTLQNPTHTYANSGTYNTTLTSTSSNGCDSSISIPVIVYPIPVPAFTASNPCFGTATTFTDNSTVTGGTITAEGWAFGDATNGTGATTTHIYPAAGTYNVELIVTSNHGCIDSITKPVVVNPIPVPGFFSDTTGCTTLCINFNNDTSSIAFPATNSITDYLWNFGDGSQDSSSTSATPKHCYTQPGTYSVQLTVTSNNGCTATLVRPNYITAWPVPVACFTANPTTLQTLTDSTVYFTDCSTGGAISWHWLTFGDLCDSMDTTQNSVHTYQENCTHSFQDTGTYCTTLAIMNKFGCKDTTTNCIHIGPMWTFYVPNAFTPNNDGLNDGFIPKAVGLVTFQMWIFDRWGQLLYHCTSLNQPWDGAVHTGPTSGNQCQEDTYVWLCEFTDVFKNSHREVGRVSIIK